MGKNWNGEKNFHQEFKNSTKEVAKQPELTKEISEAVTEVASEEVKKNIDWKKWGIIGLIVVIIIGICRLISWVVFGKKRKECDEESPKEEGDNKESSEEKKK